MSFSEWRGRTCSTYGEASKELHDMKEELMNTQEYWIGNNGILKHPFFNTHQAFLYYEKKR